MGQKTNPTILRLEKTNQHFKACWYSQYYYSDQLHNNFKIRDYICKIFQKINRCQPLIYIKNSYQSNQILCFFLKKRIRRYRRFKVKTQSRERLLPSKKWSAFCGATLKKIGNRAPQILYSTQNSHPESHLSRITQESISGAPHFPLKSSLSFSGNADNTARLCQSWRATPLEFFPKLGNSQFSLERLSNNTHRQRPVSNCANHGQDNQDNVHILKLSTLLLSAFHKQSSLLLRAKKNPNFQESKIKKASHKTQIENTINLSNFHLQGCNYPLTPCRDFLTSLKHAPASLSFSYAEKSGSWINTMHFPSSRPHTKKTQEGVPLAAWTCFQEKKNGSLTLEKGISSRKKTRLYPIKISKVTQNSDFIAQKIIGDLKKRIPYNRLRRQILRDVAKSAYVKGIRVTLSGRVKSQSRKAQKARTNTFHWGQTELHVFSSMVQFTNNYCITPFGKIGIKVWVCYHS